MAPLLTPPALGTPTTGPNHLGLIISLVVSRCCCSWCSKHRLYSALVALITSDCGHLFGQARLAPGGRIAMLIGDNAGIDTLHSITKVIATRSDLC